MTTDTDTIAATETATDTAYKQLIDLQAENTNAALLMADMEQHLQTELLALIDKRRSEYAEIQESLSRTNSKIEAIAIIHPEWFEKKKTLTTPYGSVAFRKTTKLVVKNEEVTIVLIEQRGEDDKAAYLRTETKLNLEALEKLDDKELKALRITRETAESCTIKPAKINLGKAVALADKEKAKAAASKN